MPKIVDHNKRKEEIAKATWRVISREGMRKATVRNIANEAGISLGALRYYFSTQEELLIFAMKLVHEQVKERMEKIFASPMNPKEKLTALMLELIPYNDVTRIEMEVWLEFVIHYRKSGIPMKMTDGIRSFVEFLINILQEEGLLKKDRDKDFEAERLYALIDGLAIHAVMEPERLNAERIRGLFMRHFEEICDFPK